MDQVFRTLFQRTRSSRCCLAHLVVQLEAILPKADRGLLREERMGLPSPGFSGTQPHPASDRFGTGHRGYHECRRVCLQANQGGQEKNFSVRGLGGRIHLAGHGGQETRFVGGRIGLGPDFRFAGLAQRVQGQGSEVCPGDRAFLRGRSGFVPQGGPRICEAFAPHLFEESKTGQLVHQRRNPRRAQGERAHQSFSPRL